MVNLILLSLFFLFSKPILQVLFGPAYLSASLPLIILSTGYFFGYLLRTSTRVLMTLKKTKLIFVNTLIITIINIILNLILIPKYGITGAAIATASAFLIRAILLFTESCLLIRIVPLKLSHLKILFSTLLSLLVVKFFLNFFSIQVNFLYLILFSTLFILIYISFLILTRSFEKEDILILKAIKEKLFSYF